MPQAIYLIRDARFVDTKEDIYKLGMTKQEGLKRYKNYPKRSELKIQIECIDCVKVENQLLKLFNKKYIHLEEHGKETFKGDWYQMRLDIIEYVNKEYLDSVGSSSSTPEIKVQSKESDLIDEIFTELKNKDDRFESKELDSSSDDEYDKFEEECKRELKKETSNWKKDTDTINRFINDNKDASYPELNLKFQSTKLAKKYPSSKFMFADHMYLGYLAMMKGWFNVIKIYINYRISNDIYDRNVDLIVGKDLKSLRSSSSNFETYIRMSVRLACRYKSYEYLEWLITHNFNAFDEYVREGYYNLLFDSCVNLKDYEWYENPTDVRLIGLILQIIDESQIDPFIRNIIDYIKESKHKPVLRYLIHHHLDVLKEIYSRSNDIYDVNIKKLLYSKTDP